MLVVDWFKFSNALTDRQLVARENNETRIKTEVFLSEVVLSCYFQQKNIKSKSQKVIAKIS